MIVHHTLHKPVSGRQEMFALNNFLLKVLLESHSEEICACVFVYCGAPADWTSVFSNGQKGNT